MTFLNGDKMFYRVHGVEFLLDSGTEEYIRSHYPQMCKWLRNFLVTDELDYFSFKEVERMYLELK